MCGFQKISCSNKKREKIWNHNVNTNFNNEKKKLIIETKKNLSHHHHHLIFTASLEECKKKFHSFSLFLGFHIIFFFIIHFDNEKERKKTNSIYIYIDVYSICVSILSGYTSVIVRYLIIFLLLIIMWAASEEWMKEWTQHAFPAEYTRDQQNEKKKCR